MKQNVVQDVFVSMIRSKLSEEALLQMKNFEHLMSSPELADDDVPKC